MKKEIVRLILTLLLIIAIISMLPKQIPKVITTNNYKVIYVKGTEKEIITREIIKEVEWYQFHATGYSANDPLQGTTDIMYSGRRVYIGAIAADFSVLPLGAKMEIKEMGFFMVEDCGGAIKGNKIDIYCSTKEEALQIHRDVWVRIIDENK